jgi:hypothetical protein
LSQGKVHSYGLELSHILKILALPAYQKIIHFVIAIKDQPHEITDQYPYYRSRRTNIDKRR